MYSNESNWYNFLIFYDSWWSIATLHSTFHQFTIFFIEKGPVHVFFSPLKKGQQQRRFDNFSCCKRLFSSSSHTLRSVKLIKETPKRDHNQHACSRTSTMLITHRLLTVWFRNPGNKSPVDMENRPSFREFLDIPGGCCFFCNKRLWHGAPSTGYDGQTVQRICWIVFSLYQAACKAQLLGLVNGASYAKNVE